MVADPSETPLPTNELEPHWYDRPMTTLGLQAKVRLRQAWFDAHPDQPIPEGRAEVESLFADIEAENFIQTTCPQCGAVNRVGTSVDALTKARDWAYQRGTEGVLPESEERLDAERLARVLAAYNYPAPAQKPTAWDILGPHTKQLYLRRAEEIAAEYRALGLVGEDTDTGSRLGSTTGLAGLKPARDASDGLELRDAPSASHVAVAAAQAKCGCSCRCHGSEASPDWPGPCAGCCEPGMNCDCGRALADAAPFPDSFDGITPA